MLDLVREVSQSAHRNGLFWRVLGVTVALSFVWHYHL